MRGGAKTPPVRIAGLSFFFRRPGPVKSGGPRLPVPMFTLFRRNFRVRSVHAAG